VRFLHTSDWHVGKSIRGHSRAGEHRAVLAEIATIADEEAVSLVLVAGDLFDSAAPTAESEEIVYDGLLALADVAPVVVVAGNHDNARRLSAVSTLLALGRITVATEARRPDDGGVLTVKAGDGSPVQVATVPFVSQRAIVRAEALMSEPAFRNAQSYAQRMRAVLSSLTAGFSADGVNLMVAHLFVAGGSAGGGERAVHLADEYAVSAIDFPATASYVALGHLHRAQAIRGATAIHYCGSPLQLDFGEQEQRKQVNLVRAEPGLPAKVDAVRLRSGRRLRTLTGTVEQLAASAGDVGDAWLRVKVAEPSRPGLADEVRELLGDGVVDVRVEREVPTGEPRRARRDGRTPSQLFGDYLGERGVADPRLQRAFDELHDELADSGAVDHAAADQAPATGEAPATDPEQPPARYFRRWLPLHHPRRSTFE
jgi:exonuclease SbcD